METRELAMTAWVRWLTPLVLLSALGLGACGTKGETSPGRLRIAVVPKGTTHEFWKSIHAGALTAARELGVEILWKGPLREDDRDEQIKVVESFTIRGVDGLVIAPLDDTALVPVLADAASLGIPVAIIDSDITWDGHVSFVATDNYKGGAMAGEALGELLLGNGAVMMMRYQEGSASTMKREAGFLDTIQLRFPEIVVVSENQRSGATVEAAYQTAENLLISHPEVDGIFCPNESSVFGMLRAMQDAGLAGKVRLIGFDASPKLVEALATGEIDGLVIQNPFEMGAAGVRAIVNHLDGKPVEGRIDTGVVLVTKANMNDPEVAGLLAPDLSILGD
jgi:ribose transport system substrate-binding protein